MPSPKAKASPAKFDRVPKRDHARAQHQARKCGAALDVFLKAPPSDLNPQDLVKLRQMQANLKETLASSSDDSVILASIAAIDTWMATQADQRVNELKSALPKFIDEE
jgi:hypothetical protein